MFDRYYSSEIVDVIAHGIDDYDFTPDLLGFGASIGETGYLEIVFPKGKLFFSAVGISGAPPARPNTHMLSTGNFQEYLLALKLRSIDRRDGIYFVVLDDCKPITCCFNKNDGHCDRDYFSIDVFDPDADLYL